MSFLLIAIISQALTRKDVLSGYLYWDGRSLKPIERPNIFYATAFCPFGGGFCYFYKDGTGLVEATPWEEDISYDGATARIACNNIFSVQFTWKITDNNHIVIKSASSFKTKPTGATIQKWLTKNYVTAQYQEIKRRANLYYQETLQEYKDAMLGKTWTFEIREETETYGNPGEKKQGYRLEFHYTEGEHNCNLLRTGFKLNSILDSSTSSYSQEAYESKYTDASYPNGDDGIRKYVKQYIKYPNSVQQNGINAFAYFNLEVGANGKVTSVSCGSSGDIDQQIIEQTKKLLKQLPLPFNPATEDGQKVASTYRVDINYNLEPAIKLAKQSVSFPYSQKEEKIKVTARKDWTFTQPTNSSISARKEGSYLVISCEARNERDYNEIKDKIIVSTTDNTASYTITLSQAGAPRPFINLEKDQVTIPRDGTARTIEVTSNRQWSVSNPMAEPKIKLYVSPTNITVAASKNRSKNGRSVVYGLVTTDGEYSTSLKVYQNGRLDEKGSYTTSSSSGYGRIYDDYYGYNGRFRITYINARLGVGAPIPEFDEIYVPFNVEAFALRFYIAELSLANFRFDLSLDGFEGIAWEPQLRFLLPANEKVAIMPYIGPTCQMALNGLYNSVWWLSAGAIVRVSWGDFAHSDFSIDYHGGPWGGISMGVSIGFGSGFRK